MDAYRASPLLVRRKAALALLATAFLTTFSGATVVVQGLLGSLTGTSLVIQGGFLTVWATAAFHGAGGRLEGQVNILGLGSVLMALTLLPHEVSRTFFTLCLFGLVVFPILAVRPYQAWASFFLFPGLVLAKAVVEFIQASRDLLSRDTREETVLTLLIFLAAIPLVRRLVTLVSREIHTTEALLEVNRSLKREAGTDRLTGTWNRRHFDALVRRDMGEARRTGRPLALGFVDLDRFKQVNDQWGHQTGDEALSETVRALMKVLRQGDSLVRWGGDEFVVLCPGVGPADTRVLGEKLLKAVRGDDLLQGWNLGISVGLAVWKPGEPAEELVARADRLLYRAKEAGRDQVCSEADSEPGHPEPSV